MFEFDPQKLADIKQQTYASILQQYGLTLEEAGPVLKEHKDQISAATKKLQQAHMKAASVLAAKLDQLVKAKAPLQ